MNELQYAQRVWGDSPQLQATIAVVHKRLGNVRAASVAFNAGIEVLVVTNQDGTLTQFGSDGTVINLTQALTPPAGPSRLGFTGQTGAIFIEETTMPEVIVRKGEPVDRALKRLKNKLDAEGILEEVRRLRKDLVAWMQKARALGDEDEENAETERALKALGYVGN